jgi:beta-lactamase class A
VADRISSAVDALSTAAPGVRWSACVRDAVTAEVLAGTDPALVLPIASVGKLLLLAEVARAFDAGELDPSVPLARTAEDAVADSGLWRHLRAEALPAEDLAVLVGAVSDNLATNVLLRAVGLGAVTVTATRLGLHATALHDRVRDVRGQGQPPALASGSAGELSALMGRLDDRVLRWLAAGADLSMVAGGLGLDPLAHDEPDRGLVLRHKTGTDAGVRADAGLLQGDHGTLSYAVIAAWEPAAGDRRDPVLAAMRAVGAALRETVV